MSNEVSYITKLDKTIAFVEGEIIAKSYTEVKQPSIYKTSLTNNKIAEH